jgi:uncharacterized protein (DUF983 family)
VIASAQAGRDPPKTQIGRAEGRIDAVTAKRENAAAVGAALQPGRFVLMIAADLHFPSTQVALRRGALGRCPRCGQGALFSRYLKIVDCCSECREPYGHLRTDDAAPWLTILIVGHLVIPLVLIVEEAYRPPLELMFAIWLPVTAALTLFLLPRCKGVIAALMWAIKSEGSERT